ncbi:MAG: ABC transporter ATP-binding protein [Lachnospiraceae bacterium]|nr:ABC transporter ATP-binding protein [Lachnospiraceae bacterium]
MKGLRKEFGSKVAVNDLNLNIAKGSLFAFLGVNGAGKTTTIRMLTGLTKPSGGDARVLGHSIKDNLDEVKKVVNLSPQETSIAPNLTVRENLEFIAGIYGFDKDKVKKKTKEMIEQFSMEEVENSKSKTLSGGWQRKLSIAMALITEPKVLFLDEPTLGLDVLARRELWKQIESLKGKTGENNLEEAFIKIVEEM